MKLFHVINLRLKIINILDQAETLTGGGVYVYVNQDIAARRAEYSSLSNIGSICFELNLRKPRWLLTGIYKPPSHNEGDFIKKNLFSYLTNTTKEFHNIVLLRDFNITTENI